MDKKNYTDFISAYVKAYKTTASKEKVYQDGQKEWSRLKGVDHAVYNQRMLELRSKCSQYQPTLEGLFLKSANKPPTTNEKNVSTSTLPASGNLPESSSLSNDGEKESSSDTPTTTSLPSDSSSTTTRETPAQINTRAKISMLESKIVSLGQLKDSGFATDENLKDLNKARVDLKQAKKKLQHLLKDAEGQKKRRAEKKKLILQLASESEVNSKKLRKFNHENTGRPPLEHEYHDLHKAIIDLATAGAGADFRRRTDVLNTCKTLDDLQSSLTNMG